MDKINKNLLKIPPKQRKQLLQTAIRIKSGDLKGLNIKKLRGSKEFIRVRVGNYRIILKLRSDEEPVIVSIAKRDEKTYKNL